MHKLIEYICDELEEIERKADKEKKLSMAEIQYADTLAHLKKNILKAEEMMGMEDDMMEGESSYRGGSSYRRGSSSYRAGGESGQSRARGRGRNARRDARGRYSSEGGSSRMMEDGSSRYEGGSSRRAMGGSSYEGGSSYGDEMQDMVESIYGMMDQLPENVKMDAQRFVQKLEQNM